MLESKMESKLMGTRKNLPKGAKAVLEALKQAPEMLSARDLCFRMKLSHQNQSHECDSHEVKGSTSVASPGLTTVYRSLELLVRLGLAQAASFGDNEKRYEAVEPGEHNHHLVCKSCGNNIKLKECFLATIEDTILREYGFAVSEHLLELFGTCKTCRNQSLAAVMPARSNVINMDKSLDKALDKTIGELR
jgi:Fur family ferric uptake transcriptional regulator